MSQDKGLERQVDRRDFTLAAMLAVLGGVSITITGAQLTAANALLLNLQGTASHNHTLELSANEIAQIRDGATVARECTGATHTHMVTFN